MFQLLTKSLMRQLTARFVIWVLACIAIVAFIAAYNSRGTLEKAAFDHLSSVKEIKKGQVLSYLREKMANLQILSKSQDVKGVFGLLQTLHYSGSGDFDRPFDVASKEYETMCKEFNPFFRDYLEASGSEDIYFLSKNHGHVMYTVLRQQEALGTNLKSGPYMDSGLGKIWMKILSEEKAVMVDFSDYAPDGNLAAFIGAPVFDQGGDIFGVVVLQIGTQQINAIMQQRVGMGETGENYLIGEDHLMRSDSRFESASTILKVKVDTIATRKALERLTGTDVIDGYRGIKVLSSYAHLGLKEEIGFDFDWAIISEMDEAEVFASYRTLIWQFLLVGLILGVLICVRGYFSARSIADPLKKITDSVGRMADGDLTVSINSGDRSDEIGVLMNVIGKLLETYRIQTQMTIEGGNTVASSVSVISAAATQLATSASETSSSVNEITTTMEEMREGIHLSNEKAKHVAESSEKATQDSEQAKKDTETALNGINRINEDMDYVAEEIVKLSEQTQSIGEIISAVSDLADQSNLLSVNASIESAKAGEQGKGFAVVAMEMKSLADQSKEATDQVRSILNEIQKATSTAVMATERGRKTVAEGVVLSVKAGKSFETLAHSVIESAQASTQIAASSQQQLAGIDQLVLAMQSIKDASIQDMDGAKQLETTTKDLNDMGKTTAEWKERFKFPDEM